MPFQTSFRRALTTSTILGALLTTSTLVGSAVARPSADNDPATKTVAPAVTFQPLPPPWVLPVAGYHLTGTFGASSSLWSSTHTGLDFAVSIGTPIHAVSGGVVTDTAYDGAYGNRTVVQMPDGTEIWYCHQNSVEVSVGEQVAPGDVIGEVGATGNVTGAHLHLEVRTSPDVPVDPYVALTEHGVRP